MLSSKQVKVQRSGVPLCRFCFKKMASNSWLMALLTAASARLRLLGIRGNCCMQVHSFTPPQQLTTSFAAVRNCCCCCMLAHSAGCEQPAGTAQTTQECAAEVDDVVQPIQASWYDCSVQSSPAVCCRYSCRVSCTCQNIPVRCHAAG